MIPEQGRPSCRCCWHGMAGARAANVLARTTTSASRQHSPHLCAHDAHTVCQETTLTPSVSRQL